MAMTKKELEAMLERTNEYLPEKKLDVDYAYNRTKISYEHSITAVAIGTKQECYDVLYGILRALQEQKNLINIIEIMKYTGV